MFPLERSAMDKEGVQGGMSADTVLQDMELYLAEANTQPGQIETKEPGTSEPKLGEGSEEVSGVVFKQLRG